MEKPISMLLQEFKDTMCETINESQLPMCLVEYVLKDLFDEVHRISCENAIKEKEAYLNNVKRDGIDNAEHI